jgi:hypothetical protein
MKVIKTYQQNFTGLDAGTSWSFKFSRIYKQNPKHKLILRVNCLAQYDSGGTGGGNIALAPHLYFMKNLSGVQGSSASSTEDGQTKRISPNDFFLGALGGGVITLNGTRGDIWIVDSPSITLEELPLDPMTIYYLQCGTESILTSTTVQPFISFEIDEVDMS